VEGPLELIGLEGNLFPTRRRRDCHLHIMAAKSSGDVLGGHLYDARVFATCEIVLSEIVAEGLERHLSRSGGTSTVFIDEG
jgi:predicted DNA-binding protein with PD1-like motif